MNAASGDSDSWQEARLIPTSGINGGEEQERRATSALLAVMGSVKEFGRALTQPLGAPAGTVQTFIEVPFPLQERKLYPDGVIRVRRGQRTWTALVEVKTGNATLDPVQLENYLDIAREQGFDAVLTISNEIAPMIGQHPTAVDKRRTRLVPLHHYSWSQVLTEAVVQREHRGVADPDQAWILGELIRYLEHSRSGALEFEDMGPAWVPIRNAVLAGTMKPSDPGAVAVVNRFDALIRFAGLRLGRQLGTNVVPLVNRKEQADPALRAASLVGSLSANGTLTGAIRIPDAVAPLVVVVDLRAGRVSCHVDIDSPREGKAVTRVNWLVRQLSGAPESVRVEAFAAYSKTSVSAELLSQVRARPDCLVTDPNRDIKAFRVALDLPISLKQARGRAGFAGAVVGAIETFYADVVQSLRSWTAKPPKLRDEVNDEPVAEQLVSSSLSSQDGPETGPETGPATGPGTDAETEPETVPETPPVIAESTPHVPVIVFETVPEPRGPSRREIRRASTAPEAPGDEGWYADPDGSGRLRWWSGQAWSLHTYESHSLTV